jgi:hypothetical protein
MLSSCVCVKLEVWIVDMRCTDKMDIWWEKEGWIIRSGINDARTTCASTRFVTFFKLKILLKVNMTITNLNTYIN